MSYKWPDKDKDEILDYSIDWSRFLGDDTISGVSWFVDDNQGTKTPLKLSYWLFGRYKSIMNYRYTYFILDYSDGSHGALDSDDWDKIDLSYFEKPE